MTHSVPAPPTTPPINVTSTATALLDGTYTLSWGKPTTGPASVSYLVSENGVSLSRGNYLASSESFVGKAVGNYSYTMTACTGLGESFSCGPHTAPLLVSVLPTPVAPSTIVANKNSVNTAMSFTLSWNDEATATDGYWVMDSVNGSAPGFYSYVSSGLQLTISNLSEGQHSFKVASCISQTQCGPPSSAAVSMSVAPTPPTTAPVNLSSTTTASLNGAYTLSWGKPTTGPASISYAVLENGVWISRNDYLASSEGFVGKAVGSYSYTIAACTGLGDSFSCGPSSAALVVYALPSPVTSLSISSNEEVNTSGEFTLNWLPSDGANSHFLYLSLNGKTAQNLGNVSGTSKPFDGMDPGIYDYWVVACVDVYGGCAGDANHENIVVIDQNSPADTDNDGLLDGDEVTFGTDPLDADSDDDGLLDGEEIGFGTDPLDSDSDDDGRDDRAEILAGTDPNNFDLPFGTFTGDFYSEGRVDLDGRVDLFVNPDPTTNSAVGSFVLLQQADGTFTTVATLNDTDIAAIAAWQPTTSVELVQGDFNVDGVIDVFIKNLSSAIAGFDDQIVFASVSVGAAPIAVTAVDETFNQFFEQVYGWMKNDSYFESAAITNDWYEYEGEEKTGWWYISYINFYYSYDDGTGYLDDNDDPEDEYNTPAHCEDYPSACRFDTTAGAWFVYGTFIEYIEVVFDYSNFNEDALIFKSASGGAYHDPNGDPSADLPAAEAIFESVLQVELGETVAGVLAHPTPWPEFPPGETAPVPRPRQIPMDLPDAANDPVFGKKWGWRIIGKSAHVINRAGIVVCYLLACDDKGFSDEEEVLDWYHVGWEWALQDLLEKGIDADTEQVNVVIGETEMFLWFFNQGWLRSFMVIESYFYDIGLYDARPVKDGQVQRGLFYACERAVMGAYPWREEVYFQGTLSHAAGSCKYYYD